MVAYPVHLDRGVHLPLCDLWLDPTRRRPRAVVSHGHADHVARHDEVVCSEATHRVMGLRRKAPVRVQLPTWGEEVRVGAATVSLHPAGHVLGSSQVLVRHDGVRILYSGDIRCRPGLTAEPLEHVECDLLVMETTFGHPRYRFPPTESVIGSLVAYCVATLAAGATPVLLAYSVGKAQELLAQLAGRGLRLVVHPAVAAVVELYSELGVDLPAVETLRDVSAARGAVVVVPPHLRGLRALAELGDRRTVMLSGWAVEGAPVPLRAHCNAAFPLSDHCDYDELLEYVERSGARRVLTLHGFAADFAQQLRRRGYDAAPLRDSEQLRLALA